jgi:hypothetical protein
MHRAQAHTRDWRSVENDLLRQALASFLIQAALVTERFRDKTIGHVSGGVTKLKDIPRITASPRRPQGGGAMP